MSRPWKAGGLAVVIILALALPQVLRGNDYWISVAVVAAIMMLMVSSLRTVLLLNQISLGHVGFSALGAYGSALLMMRVGLPFWVTVPLGGLMAALLALVLSYPFLKVRGLYFSILTLLTAETLRLTAYYWPSLTGGSWGLLEIPPPASITLPGIGAVDFGTVDNYYYVAIPLVIICLALIYLIEHSHLSFKWQAIRDGDELSKSVGINVMRYMVINFVIACFFAGVAGALFAHYQHSLAVDATSRFGVVMSIYMLLYLVVGGRKSFAGPIVGTVVMTLITEFTRPVAEYQPMMIGVIAILVMLLMPEGLVELPGRLVRWRKDRKRGALTVPADPGETG